jgi:PAS domain S-box-containing protein
MTAAEQAASRRRALLAALREGVCVLDAHGRVTDASDRLCQLTGFTREELVGELAPFWPPEGAGALTAALTMGEGTFEVGFRHKDGTSLPVSVDVAGMPGEPGIVCAIRERQEICGVGTWEWFPDTDRLLMSGALHEQSGVSDQTPTLGQALAFIAAEDRGWTLAGIRRVAEGASEFVARVRVEVPAAGLDWVETRAQPVRDASGAVVRVRGSMRDISEEVRAAADAAVRAQLLDRVDAAVVATDLDGLVTHWNEGAEGIYGWSAEEAGGQPLIELMVIDADLRREVFESVLATGAWEGRFEARRKDGTAFPAYVRNSVITGDDGRPIGLVGVSLDITRRVRAEQELIQARDYLRAVTDSMGEGLCTVDTAGRVRYLNAAAERMLGWTLDELEGRRLHEATHFRRPDGSPFPAAECPIVRSRRKGEEVRSDDDVFIRKDGTDLPVAWTSAPIVMENGVSGAVVVFSDITERKREQERTARDLSALTWLTRIRDALEHDRFTLHAQPIIALATGETVQHELLIRMLGEDGEVIAPGEFLPVAEEYGLIREIDRWVIRQAAQIAGQGHPIELNLSAESLGDPGLFAVIDGELRRAGADPARVVIELTETALVRDVAAAEAFLSRVSELGCGVALDDFGTGYGGLSYVKRLPLDYLKIDVEFVRDVARDSASRHVVRAIVQLARDFGYETVAEGVEETSTLGLLRELGVDYAQGYAIARPAPIAETDLGQPGGAT